MQNELKLNFDKIISLNNFSDSQKKIKRENFKPSTKCWVFRWRKEKK